MEKRLKTAFNLEKKEPSYSMLCEAKRKSGFAEKKAFLGLFLLLKILPAAHSFLSKNNH